MASRDVVPAHAGGWLAIVALRGVSSTAHKALTGIRFLSDRGSSFGSTGLLRTDEDRSEKIGIASNDGAWTQTA